MKISMKNLPASAVLALLLAACGGHDSGSGDSGAGSAQQSEDASASASVPGLLSFAQGQIARGDADTSEPRDIAGITLPQSDIAEPAPL